MIEKLIEQNQNVDLPAIFDSSQKKYLTREEIQGVIDCINEAMDTFDANIHFRMLERAKSVLVKVVS